MRDFIEQFGSKAVSTFKNVSGFCRFSLKCLREFLQGSFFNRAAFDVLVMQIFFTAYQLLNFFVVLSAVFGSIFIGIVFQTVKSFGLVQYLGNIVMGVVVLEFSPLITVVLLALRSSSAVNSEIAVMKVNREIDALDVKCDEAWCAIRTKPEYDAYRKGLKAKMMSAIGTMPARTSLNARTVATLKRDGYTIEKVVFESMPGIFVTANLFIPDGSGRRPAVVMSCGHADEGKDCGTYLRVFTFHR